MGSFAVQRRDYGVTSLIWSGERAGQLRFIGFWARGSNHDRGLSAGSALVRFRANKDFLSLSLSQQNVMQEMQCMCFCACARVCAREHYTILNTSLVDFASAVAFDSKF